MKKNILHRGLSSGGFVELVDIEDYLTIEALEDGLTASLSTNACEYCVDFDGNWKSLSADTATEAINTGQTLSFRGNLTPSDKGIGTFTVNKNFNLKGNVMSMLFGNVGKYNYSLRGKNYAFYKLFYNCSNIVNVSKNFLPATTLSDSCYYRMFNGCSSLTTAPELPATTLANSCYYDMFQGCTALTTAPELPATKLTNICYEGMFENCTSLTTAPELPAKTLTRQCYYSMFENCTALTTAPELPATTLATYCYYSMFENCTALTTAPELPATTLADSCYANMFADTNVIPNYSNIDFTSSSIVASGGLKGLFSGTKVTDSDLEELLPKNTNGKYFLPATTLADSCYYQMFYNCTNLTIAPELPATTLAKSCYNYMFCSCTSLTTAPELPATILADSCYYYMFFGCSSLTKTPELPATTLAKSCYSYMFYGCTSLTTAPELPATILADSCYYYMFWRCYKLNYIKMLATDISASSCLSGWVRDVAPTGTFVKNPAMTTLSTGSSGIPSGWTVVNDGDKEGHVGGNVN